MLICLIWPLCALGAVFRTTAAAASEATPFGETIFSIYPERDPYCPTNYTPDANYRACCGPHETVTSALGPDEHMSPACCLSSATCTGLPPKMYDWTTDDAGSISVITPTEETKVIGKSEMCAGDVFFE